MTAHPTTTPPAPPTPANGRPRILLVDDEPALLSAMRRQLQSRFQVQTCDDPVVARSRVADIDDLAVVGAPGQTGQQPADLNAAIESTVVVTRSAYRQVAALELDLGQLPPVLCRLGELNQVFLNLIVNAAHAVADKVAEHGGPGVFFTTKDVGRGTGQGLALARSVVVDHHGSLTVDSTPDEGTTFTLRLPVGGTEADDPVAASAADQTG